MTGTENLGSIEVRANTIGFSWRFTEAETAVSLDERCDYRSRTLESQPHQQFVREMGIMRRAIRAVLKHLGFPYANVLEDLELGCTWCEDYFTTDWWEPDGEDRLRMQKGIEGGETSWFNPYSYGVFQMALLGRWDQIKRVSAWIDDAIVADYFERQRLDDFGLLIAWCAYLFQGTSMPREEDAREVFAASKDKRTSLHYRVVDAINNEDEKGFQKSLGPALTHFIKKDMQIGNNPVWAVAVHLSILCCFASSKELSLPKLNPKQDAVLVRPETIGVS